MSDLDRIMLNAIRYRVQRPERDDLLARKDREWLLRYIDRLEHRPPSRGGPRPVTDARAYSTRTHDL